MSSFNFDSLVDALNKSGSDDNEELSSLDFKSLMASCEDFLGTITIIPTPQLRTLYISVISIFPLLCSH